MIAQINPVQPQPKKGLLGKIMGGLQTAVGVGQLAASPFAGPAAPAVAASGAGNAVGGTNTLTSEFRSTPQATPQVALANAYDSNPQKAMITLQGAKASLNALGLPEDQHQEAFNQLSQAEDTVARRYNLGAYRPTLNAKRMGVY